MLLQAQRVGRGIALLFHDAGNRRGWVVSSTPQPHFTPAKNHYPFYRRLGGPQDQCGWAENLVPTGIRSQTVQAIFSCYTELSHPAHTHTHIYIYIYILTRNTWSSQGYQRYWSQNKYRYCKTQVTWTWHKTKTSINQFKMFQNLCMCTFLVFPH